MRDKSVHCCVTSPPYYGLRDYGVDGQLGLEKTPEEYVAKMVEVFREVRRVLRDDGTLWLNLGDSYAGGGGGNYNKTGVSQAGGQHITNVRNRDSWLDSAGLKPKDLIGIPWRVAFALQADGWYLRQDIIWHKPNPMPESVTDRCTKAHEYVFLMAKSQRYYYDAEAVAEPGNNTPHAPGWISAVSTRNDRSADNESNSRDWGAKGTRNRRSVWTVTTKPFKGSHFATFPPDLIEPMIKAGCPVGGTVLDPFFGAGTTGLVALKLGRDFVGIDVSPVYCKMAESRIYGSLLPDQQPEPKRRGAPDKP